MSLLVLIRSALHKKRITHMCFGFRYGARVVDQTPEKSGATEAQPNQTCSGSVSNELLRKASALLQREDNMPADETLLNIDMHPFVGDDGIAHVRDFFDTHTTEQTDPMQQIEYVKALSHLLRDPRLALFAATHVLHVTAPWVQLCERMELWDTPGWGEADGRYDVLIKYALENAHVVMPVVQQRTLDIPMMQYALDHCKPPEGKLVVAAPVFLVVERPSQDQYDDPPFRQERMKAFKQLVTAVENTRRARANYSMRGPFFDAVRDHHMLICDIDDENFDRTLGDAKFVRVQTLDVTTVGGSVHSHASGCYS